MRPWTEIQFHAKTKLECLCIWFHVVRGGEGEDPGWSGMSEGALLTVRARTGGDVQDHSRWPSLR